MQLFYCTFYMVNMSKRFFLNSKLKFIDFIKSLDNKVLVIADRLEFNIFNCGWGHSISRKFISFHQGECNIGMKGCVLVLPFVVEFEVWTDFKQKVLEDICSFLEYSWDIFIDEFECFTRTVWFNNKLP